MGRWEQRGGWHSCSHSVARRATAAMAPPEVASPEEQPRAKAGRWAAAALGGAWLALRRIAAVLPRRVRLDPARVAAVRPRRAPEGLRRTRAVLRQAAGVLRRPAPARQRCPKTPALSAARSFGTAIWPA